MSRVFYDHLIRFERLEVHITSITASHEERHELWDIVDKLVHNRIIKKILNVLPDRHHDEFADMLHDRPYDKNIIKFLNESSDEDMEKFIRKEMQKLEEELLQELKDGIE